MSAANTSAQRAAGRGTNTPYPWQIPLHGWSNIARRVARRSLRDHVFIVSSGVAFLALFALVPMLTALISVYGLVSSPGQLSHQLQSLSSVAPQGVINTLRGALDGIVRDSGLRLGFGVVLSILVAVYVAARGVLGIISALNIVYEEKERRSVPALLVTALALALGALVFWLTALALIVGAPWVIRRMSADSAVLRVLVLAARWLVVAAGSLVSMTVLYRFGPSHADARWEWLSAGSVVGTALWLAGSAGMSFYVAHLSGFGNAYGSLGTVMVVMTWFFLTAFVFLLGAEFNVAMEREIGLTSASGR
ncbi:MAG: YihY/virulence factor BrkB family protein [Rhodanobacteraceae bacterium]